MIRSLGRAVRETALHLHGHVCCRENRYDHEVRKVLYTTNIIESLNARFRQATRRRRHFPTEPAAMKVLYLVFQQKRKRL